MCRRTMRVWPLAAASLLLVSGCVSIEEIAPPVTPLLVGGTDSSAPVLEQGRAVYLGSCVKCHAAESVTRYEPAQWERILPEMTKRARLDDENTAAVRAYVEAVLAASAESSPAPPAPSP